MNALRDRCGRPVTYLRVSVTDRCNLRCRYCMPAEGVALAPAVEVLTFEEITRAVRVAADLGLDRIRLTGGEPLLRRQLDKLIRMLREETSVRELALTTNALLLDRQAESLRAAGLDRLNVSVDSLHQDRFEKLTRSAVLSQTWRGIEAAIAAGFAPLKINVVVVDGFNDDEIEEWAAMTIERDLTVRFLEVMPIGEGAELRRLGGYHNLTAARARLQRSLGIAPTQSDTGAGPARYWQVPGGRGKLGFITPLSDPYCDTCSRFRLTSTGRLRPCLAYDTEIDLSAAIHAGDEDAIAEGFRRAAAIKPDGHQWRQGHVTRTGMSELGG